jgi:hypothetical protein
MALRTGIPAASWLEDTSALVTAVEILDALEGQG